MAEYCIKCNKKMGFWEIAALYVAEDKPICNQCAQPIAGCFESLYHCNAEDLVTIGDQLAEICENTYGNELSKLITNKFAERRKQMGLLTTEEKEERNRQKLEHEEKVINLPMTTTNNFEGCKIVKYIKVISEEIIFKNSVWKRLDAGLEDLGNAFSFKQTEMSGASELIANAREYALEKFKRKAVNVGANAVVGVEFESSFGSDVVRVAIFGTAVIISENESH